MKKKIIITVGVISLLLIGLAIAGGPGGGWHLTPEEKVGLVKSRIVEKLGLDDAQKSALDRITGEILAEHQQVSESREAFKSSFLALLQKENLTAEELKTLFDTKKPTIDNWMQMAAGHIAEFHRILTPEQRATLIDEIESYHGRRCRFWR